MTKEDKKLLLQDLCARLPYGVRGKVRAHIYEYKADTVLPRKYDIDGFPVETTFDVDVELLRIDASNDEIFVSTFDNNEDLGNYIEECQIDGTPWTIEEFTPYLRPMSSMTEEEKKDFLHLTNWDENDLIDIIKYSHMYEFTISIKAFDWLNKNYFDYRGLIPKGLAIEVTEKNNPYK